MQPGDMPQFDPAITMAHKGLTDPEKAIGTKHIILVSDGDHGLLGNQGLLNRLRNDRITMTTVGVTTHGPAAQQALAAISQPTGGRHYAVTDPSQLPAIYIKETRVINQSFVYERQFTPQFTAERGDPLREWSKTFPSLHGYVRTQAKDSQLVQILLRSPVPGDDLNPILAQWQYGLGRVVAFTSDAGAAEKSWARDWAKDEGGVFTEFWGRIMDWAMRNVDEAGLTLQSRYENGKVRITLLDNRDRDSRTNRPLGAMQLTLTSPNNKDSKTVTLAPVSAGVYEAVVDAEGSGSYTATVSGTLDSGDPKKGPPKPVILARDAFSVPYSSEFSTVKSNEGLLEQIARETGGRVIDETALAQADIFRHDESPAFNLQPIWYWLVFAAAVLLFFDVGIRRVAVDPEAIGAKLKVAWERMRGKRKLSQESQQYIDRLKSRKQTVAAQLQQPDTAKRRFEAPVDAPPVEVSSPAGPAAPPRPRAPVDRPKLGAEQQEEAMDFATRLMRAKQKAREQIDKKTEQ
jgi:hypothetical protein